MPKKKEFSLHVHSKFLHLTTVFMDSKNSFRPNLLDLEKKIDFAHSMTPFWPPTVVHPKSTKLAF